MLLNNRIIWEDNVTLIDASIRMSNLHAQTLTFAYTTAEDYLYLGSDLPFNHRFIDVGGTPNAVVSVASVEIWDGNAWNAAVDVLDETSNSSGVSLAQDGILRWVCNKNYSWSQEETTEDIPALATLKIYNLYWARVSWSATLTAGTLLNYIGHSFAVDANLGAYYPDLVRSDILGAYETGKSTWKDQHVLAAEEIIADVKRKKLIKSGNQILNPEVFNLAAVHKCAEIIMRGLGKDWDEPRAAALKDYAVALNTLPLGLDSNEDGKIDESERSHVTGLYRA